MLIREALAADIPALVALRMQLFCEVGELATSEADPALWQATRDYFTQSMQEGSARSWVVEVDNALVACGTLALFVRPPYPGNLAGREAYVLNMYIRPAWRRRGLAGGLLDAMLAHAREQRLGKLWLHASDEGRPLYERLGFLGNPACLELSLST
ncbi:GNAT family N-acetyltransferase [Aeromonas lusitana]|uniref:GNAT family N-acetyltransferase n=1 Tax=Aeromonas lusitana TaxID=931529 RepID=A0A2M8H8N5_9GAMM|nr:GNAT family N-acetyltransferase [Aeromonas lusitana]PJC92926.1 GNAT family N-acetyltransferase [Aeromonas lusitana]